MNISERFRPLIIAAICIVFILIRFWDITSSCLWFDEIFSIHAAEHSWGTLFSFVAQDLIHPPLFYVVLKLWMLIGGDNLFWVRFLPVFFSIVALVPLLLLCRELKLKFLAVVVALSFFAVNGSLIKYAQEVRMYSLLLCLSLFSIWLFSRFFNRGKNIWLLTMINILLVYTHYFGWFVVLSEVAAILVLQRIKIRHVLLMFAVTFVSFVPWIVAVVQAAKIGADVKQNIGWIAKPGFASIFELVFDVIEPFYYQQSSAEATSNFYVAIPMLSLIGAAKVLYLINWKSEADKSGLYVLAIFAAVPLVVAFVASWLLPVSIWGSRHLIIVFAPMMILSAVVLTEIRIRPIKIVFVATLFTLFGVAFAVRLNSEQPQYIWCAWENLAIDWIKTPHLSSDPKTLYVFEDLVGYHFWFSVRNLENYQVKIASGMEGTLEDTAYFLPRGFNSVEKINAADIGGDSFWIAFRDSKPQKPLPGFTFITEQKPPLSTLVGRRFIPEDVKKFEAGDQVASLVLMRKDPLDTPTR